MIYKRVVIKKMNFGFYDMTDYLWRLEATCNLKRLRWAYEPVNLKHETTPILSLMLKEFIPENDYSRHGSMTSKQ